MRRVALAVLCATGCSAPTTLLLDIGGSPSALQSLSVTLTLADGQSVLAPLPDAPLPGRAVVKLADLEQDVQLSLDAVAADGSLLHDAATAHALPHRQVTVELALGAVVTPDLGGADLTAVDFAAVLAYRRALTVQNGAAALPAGYSIRVPIDALLFPAGKVRSDLSDVRVFDGANQIDRAVDLAPPGATRALWFALQRPIAANASDTAYALEYGDPNASAAPADATKVFAAYDDFTGATLSSLWQMNGAPSLANGELTLHKNGVDGICTTAATDKVPILSALEWRSRVTDPASAGQSVNPNTFWWWAGYQRYGDFTAADPWVLFIQRAPNQITVERKVTSGTACASVCTSNALTPALDAQYHWYRIERGATATLFFRDGVQVQSIADPNNDDYSLLARNYSVSSDLIVDWLRARPLASPEPTVTIGAETALP
jgi:hypothetical protein